MWKYVSRRFKEIYERTQSLLDFQKSCLYGVQQKSCQDDIVLKSCSETTDFQCQNQVSHYHKEKLKDREDNFNDTFLGAITWSGAIVCGWYASQVLCLYQRRLGWEPQFQNSKLINIPCRSFHSKLILERVAFTSPSPPSLLSEKTLFDNFSFEIPKATGENSKVYEVNNDGGCKNSFEPNKQTVEDAVTDLVKFLGETEFKMGVENLSAGRYKLAVSHLKLATRHKHAGATFNLGLCYEKGIGVAKNLQRAMEYYQIASSLGHTKAMYNLGVFYAHGLGGLKKDETAAEKCFLTAAKLGQNEAKIALTLKNDLCVMF